LTLQGRALDAREQLTRAEQLLGSSPDIDDLASLRVEQAKTAAELEEGETAVKLAREAIELVGGEESGHSEYAHAIAALGQGFALTGAHDEANEMFRRAVDLLSEQGLWRAASNTCRSWGKFLREAGREAEAFDALDRAAELAAHAAARPARIP
jgi:tetratricopeptide (TPR) repeat protein